MGGGWWVVGDGSSVLNRSHSNPIEATEARGGRFRQGKRRKVKGKMESRAGDYAKAKVKSEKAKWGRTKPTNSSGRDVVRVLPFSFFLLPC